jgi:hypothetical protein
VFDRNIRCVSEIANLPCSGNPREGYTRCTANRATKVSKAKKIVLVIGAVVFYNCAYRHFRNKPHTSGEGVAFSVAG